MKLSRETDLFKNINPSTEKSVLNMIDYLYRKEIYDLDCIITLVDQTNEDFVTYAERVISKNIKEIEDKYDDIVDLLIKACRIVLYKGLYCLQYEILLEKLEKLKEYKNDKILKSKDISKIQREVHYLALLNDDLDNLLTNKGDSIEQI